MAAAQGASGPSAPDPSDEAVAAASSLCSDSRRSLVATVPSVVLPTILGFFFGAVLSDVGDGPATTVALSLLGWNVFVVVYVILTIRTFGGVDGAEFSVRMAARARRRRRPGRPGRLDPRNDGPTFAIESSVVAFAVVLVLPHIDPINLNVWLLVPASVSILLSCWALSIVSYALHYAQHDLATPSLQFPGDRTSAWADYVYFSIAVATTLGATDVSVTTPHMRRVVNLHVVLTFIYNSVIVALLAALLIR